MRRLSAALLTIVLLVGCSGDATHEGSMAEFCAGAAKLRTNLAGLVLNPNVTLNDIRAARDQMDELDAPPEIRADLEQMVAIIDEVLAGFDGADPNDPAAIDSFSERLAGLEGTAETLSAASDRLVQAVQLCPDGS